MKTKRGGGKDQIFSPIPMITEIKHSLLKCPVADCRKEGLPSKIAATAKVAFGDYTY